MLVLNCPTDFHEKYFPYSKNQLIESIPEFQKTNNLENIENKENQKFKKELSKEISISLPISKKNSENIEDYRFSIKSKKSNVHRVNESQRIEEEEEDDINIMKKMTKYKNIQEVKIEDIMKNSEDTRNNIKFINKLLSKINLGYDKLVENILKLYSEKIGKKIEKENKNYYEKGMEYLNNIFPKLKSCYYEIQYEDIIYLICSLIKYFTHLKVKLELGEQKENLMIIIYGNEEIYDFLAELSNYPLQLKPYAYKYVLFEKEYIKKLKDMKTLKDFNDNKNNENDDESEYSQLFTISNESFYTPIQFEDLNTLIPYNYPPYKTFKKDKELKYRRYEKNDLYHECPNIPLDKEMNCQLCSKYRNIDKLRLITISIDKLLSLNYLKKKKVLIMKLYQRNYECYEEILKSKNLFDNSWNIFSEKKGKYLINLVRNFLGECVSYYYLFVNDYIIWLIPPSILGILVEILIKILPLALEPDFLGKTPITYLDIILLIFCGLTNIWIILFLQSWKQKEKLYAYFWGTEYYTRQEPDREDFKPDLQKEFVFGEKLKFVEPLKRRIKKFVSYLVLFFMMFLTCIITFFLLNYKQTYLIILYDDEEDDEIDITPKTFWHDTFVSIVFASINAIQIKLFGLLYNIIAKKLNKWENYQKEYQSINDLTIKLILFEFTNNYSACFYIGFIKPNTEKQCAGTCIHEMEIQLYTTYGIFFFYNLIEIGIPIILYNYRRKRCEKSIKNMIKEKYPNLNEKERKDKLIEYSNIKYQSTIHQLLVEEADNMIYEYTEIIILFGFVCLFSSSAPLTPLIILILIWTEKIVDIFKMFYFERFEHLDKDNGIGIYKFLMTLLVFFGQLTNIGVVLFSKSFRINNDTYYKVVIFLCIENFVLIIGFLLNINVLPKWFEYLTDLKELYTIKYYKRNEENLPHLKFLNRKKYNDNTENEHRKISEGDLF